MFIGIKHPDGCVGTSGRHDTNQHLAFIECHTRERIAARKGIATIRHECANDSGRAGRGVGIRIGARTRAGGRTRVRTRAVARRSASAGRALRTTTGTRIAAQAIVAGQSG